jgi:tryptophan-rich sensory protein
MMYVMIAVRPMQPNSSAEGRWSEPGSLIALAGLFALTYLAAFVGSQFTFPAIPVWYEGLEKPGFAPPNWLFAPVWTLLYGLMAFAAWRVWLQRYRVDVWLALTLFALQLALNVGWSALFFGLRNPFFALLEIVILDIAILATLVAFARIDRLAGLAIAPYLAWVAFATALNGAVWWLNPTA